MIVPYLLVLVVLVATTVSLRGVAFVLVMERSVMTIDSKGKFLSLLSGFHRVDGATYFFRQRVRVVSNKWHDFRVVVCHKEGALSACLLTAI